MVTEDYVSFETAKLLKEKGFDWLESPFYSEQDRDEWSRNAWYSIPNPRYDENIQFDSPTLYVIAPHISIQMAMKWLREVHNIHINLDIHWLHFVNQNGWMYIITKILENGVEYVDCKGDESDETFYSTYQEACEAAIKYCLEKLI